MQISVIIPTRNRSRQLKRALESVASQTFKCQDVIVIDDGSSDEEAARIKLIVEQIPRCKLIRNQTSMGAPISRNLGARECGGDVIAFLDSDDWWEAQRLERHVDALIETPASVISYNIAELVWPDGTFAGISNDLAPDPSRSALSQVAAANFLGGCSSVCLRHADFHAVGGFNPNLLACQDWDLWFRILKRGGDVSFVDKVSTKQEVGRADRITAQKERVLAGHDHMMNQIFAEQWSASEHRYIKARHFEVRAWIAYNFREYGKATGNTLCSLLHQPTRKSAITLARYSRRWLKSIVMPESS